MSARELSPSPLESTIRTLQSQLPVGNFAHCANAWPPQTWAHRVVRHGVTWSWQDCRRPPLLTPTAPVSVQKEVREAILEMVSKGVLLPAQPDQSVFLSRIFLVPKRDSDKMRPIIDLSRLNRYIACPKFRMLTVTQVRHALWEGAWTVSLDLSEAYWHVPVNRRLMRYLSVRLDDVTYQFAKLPFGLNVAPRIFTFLVKTALRPLIKKENIVILFYLDDWLIVADSEEACLAQSRRVVEYVSLLGFNINVRKSHLRPTQSPEWLGLMWDTTSCSVALSDSNRKRIRKKLYLFLHSRFVTRRRWESVVGSLNWAQLAVPLGKLRLRRLIRMGNRCFPASAPFALRKVPRSLAARLAYWLRPRTLSASQPWYPPPPSLSVDTDASGEIGWGYQSTMGHQDWGVWSQNDRRHINAKELSVPLFFLREHGESLRGESVAFAMDNTSAVACINHQGSTRSTVLHSLTEAIHFTALRHGVSISASYLQGVSNVWADSLSRGRSTLVEWELLQSRFDSLIGSSLRPQVDLFASHSTAKTPLYLTRWSVTEAGGPDALTVDWSRWTSIYLFPPPDSRLMGRVVSKLRGFHGQVALICPIWMVQPWYLQVHRWCPNPRPLPLRDFLWHQAGVQGTSLNFALHSFLI